MSIYEALMLLCFGAAWPVSIWKSYRSKSTKGKSMIFLIILIVGYLAGIVNKLLYFPGDPVLYLYILNMVMVGIDLLLFLRNVGLERREEK